MTGIVCGLTGDIQQDPYRRGREQHTGSAGTYERQGQAFGRQYDGYYADFDGGLYCDCQDNSACQQLPETVPASHDHKDSQHDEYDKKGNDYRVTCETELFTDDCEDEIRRIFRDVAVFTYSLA